MTDIATAIDKFFESQGSSEAQRGDAVAVLQNQCGNVGGVVVLTATGEALDTENSRKWIAEHKPHLLPPKFERSLADRAFVDGNMTARTALVKEIGSAEANKIAQRYGLHSVSDTRRGTPPAEPVTDKKNGKTGDHSNNPFHKSNWNVSKQGSLLRAVGPEKTAAIAASVGSRIGATRPNEAY